MLTPRVPGLVRHVASLLALVAVLGGGCTTTSAPTGGSWKSVAATRVLGMALREATQGADTGFAAGKTVAVTSAGFDDDEIGSYFRLLVGEAIYRAGGTVAPDGDLDARINVHVSGVDRVSFFLVPFFETTRLTSTISADLVVRDSAGKVVARQPLGGSAKFEETIILTFFTMPGQYYVRRDRAWIGVEHAESFLAYMYWHAAGLMRGGKEPPEE